MKTNKMKYLCEEKECRSMNTEKLKLFIQGRKGLLPKIEAAITYLEKVPGGKVLITNQASIDDAIKGKAGTVITA